MSITGVHPLVTELMRRLREQWLDDLAAALRRIDPSLLSGSISPGALPAGTVRETGTWSATASYRYGDLVVVGGSSYLALQPSMNVAVSNSSYWLPLGSATVPPPFDYIVDGDGAYLVDGDGAYLFVYV